MVTEAVGQAGATVEDESIIENRREIESLMVRLTTQHCLLIATGPQFTQSCKTSLLDVNIDDDILTFDALMPLTANHLLTPGDPINLHGWLDGVQTDIRVAIQDTGVGEDNEYFTTPLPDSVRYLQRRAQYRIKFPVFGKSPCATIQPDTAEALDTEMTDLSTGGVGFTYPGEADFSYRQCYDCLLHLPEKSLLTKIKPRSVRHMGTPRKTHVGAQFVDLPPTAHGALERYIASVQREKLRRRREQL